MSEIKINNKTIFLISAIILGMIGLIFFLNSVDNERKMNQVSQIYNLIEESPYKERLKNKIINFDTSNHELAFEIVETVGLIRNENNEISNVKLFIQNNDGFYEFPYYNYDRRKNTYRKRKNLSIEIEKLMKDIVNNKKDAISILQEFNKNSNKLEIINFISEEVCITNCTKS